MREYRVGRLLDHVHLRVCDLAASVRFYRSALDVLGCRGNRARAGSKRTSCF